jgi:hypothetical protein
MEITVSIVGLSPILSLRGTGSQTQVPILPHLFIENMLSCHCPNVSTGNHFLSMFYCYFMGTNSDCPSIARFLFYEEEPIIAFISLRYAYIILAMDVGYL